jgi:hypothetical protein
MVAGDPVPGQAPDGGRSNPERHEYEYALAEVHFGIVRDRAHIEDTRMDGIGPPAAR